MESGYRSFAENFSDCCSESCNYFALERRKMDADYAVNEQACDALYSLIKEKLGNDDKLINKFDAAKNHAFAFDEVWIYQQGFQDCVYILRWIGIL